MRAAYVIVFILAFSISVSVAAAQNVTEPEDLCEGVTCSDSVVTCPDGFEASCTNTCDSSTGACSECTPSCEGHENLCEGVTCDPTETTCPDGTVVSCENTCDAATGECSVCEPSCEGHEAEPQETSGENETEDAGEDLCPHEDTRCSGHSIEFCFDPAKGYEVIEECSGGEECVEENGSVFCELACPDADKPSGDFCPNGDLYEEYDDRGCVTGYGCSQTCPDIDLPDEGFCSDGHIRDIYDDTGCLVDFECITTCGDGICQDYEEGLCPEDCNVPRESCPISVACPDGSKAACRVTDDGCFCEQCPLTDVPPGCHQERDDNGFLRVVCEEKCEPVPQSVRQECVESGGFPVIEKIGVCEEFYCDFGDGRNPFQGRSECKSPEEVEENLGRCEDQGLRGTISFDGQCKVAKCVPHEENQCRQVTRRDIERKRAECNEQGQRLLKEFDENGCPFPACGDELTCQRHIPDEAYRICAEEGGELIVRHGNDGCVAFSECVTRGDVRDVYLESEEVAIEDLLDVAFKLERLKVALDKLVTHSEDIAAYYRSEGSEEAERFERVAGVFEGIRSEIDAIRGDIRRAADSGSRDDALRIRKDIRYVKDVMLKDALYVMLGSGDEIDDIKSGREEDCGTNGACFDRAFRICKKITFLPDGRDGPVVRLEGVEDGKCVMKAEMPAELVPPGSGSFDMTCRIPNFARGMEDPEEIIEFCEGPMADAFRSGEFDDRGPGGPGGPGGCRTDRECEAYCRDNIDECIEFCERGDCPPGAIDDLRRMREGGFPDEFGGEFEDEFDRDFDNEFERDFDRDFGGEAGESCAGCFDNGVCDPGECSFCGDCGGG